jgi:PAS domain S-box-containing protein
MFPSKNIKDYLKNLNIYTIRCSVVIIENNLNIIYVNNSFCKLLGYKSNAIVGKSIIRFLDPSNQKIFQFQCEAEQMDECFLYEFTFIRKNSNKVYSFISTIPIIEEKDNFKGKLLIIHDFTAKIENGDLLKESENGYNNMLSAMVDLIFVLDKDGRFIYYKSPAFEDLYLEPEKFMGKKHIDIMPEHLNKLFIAAFEKNKNNEISEYEYWLKIGDKRKAYSARLSPIFSKNKFYGSIAVVRNITDRKKMEETLKHSREKLKDQYLALEQKNIALTELIEQIQVEKKKVEENVTTNISEILIPIIKKLQINVNGEAKIQLQLLESSLTKIITTFGTQITDKKLKLTSREIELCNMIKNGLSSKEIGKILNISNRTIEKHRFNIRKKLGIIESKVNLVTYIKNI